MNYKNSKKGFTLIELLVVIAIIAILSIVVILTLNPAELLRQARDSNRVSDLSTIKSAISLFLADTASSSALGAYNTCFQDVTLGGGKGTSTLGCAIFFTQVPTTTIVGSTTLAAKRKVDGTGWIPINFNAISSGAPIGQEPVDPVDDNNFFYAYRASTTVSSFKLAVKLESTKYTTSPGDLISTDGGVDATTYETGTLLTL